MSLENIILFISSVKSRFDRSINGEIAWQSLCNEFSGFSDAWNIEEDGVLFWQSMLPKNAALLAYAIKNPPPTGMGQKSTSGLGIWDVIMPHSYNTFSTVALHRLHEKTKIDTTIQFSRPWYTAGIDLARATLADHPEGWVGKPSPKQDRWAVEMLVYLCSSLSQEEETAFQTYLLLIEDERHRATLGPVARGVLRVINYLHERGLLNKSVDSFKRLDQEGDKKWAAFVLRELPKKAKKLDVAADKIAAALSFVQNQALHDKTPASFPKQAHCPRRM